MLLRRHRLNANENKGAVKSAPTNEVKEVVEAKATKKKKED